MNRLLLVLASLIILSCFTKAQTSSNSDTLTVGLNTEPPFIMQQKDGSWEGMSIYLWEEIANDLDYSYTYQAFELEQLINALEKGRVDIGITPLTVTGERFKQFDFTQPFFISTLTVATAKKESNKVLLFLSNFVSGDFLWAVFLLFMVILVFGLLLWIPEKRANSEMFGSGLKGIWDGIWWSAVTMTTVGYGDKAPKSNAGKVIAIIWMFTAVIIVSTFTATIASSLTVNTLDANINRVEDLRKVKSGTVAGSTGEAFMENKGWTYEAYPDAKKALEALQQSQIEALVYDAPILQYLVKNQNLQKSVEILPFQLNKQYYSFSLPRNSPLKDEINPLLVKTLESPGWQHVREKYEGD